MPPKPPTSTVLQTLRHHLHPRPRTPTAQRPPHHRTLIAPPRTNTPLLERRADRALPELPSRRRLYLTIPVFGLLVAGAAAAIFNYQKSSSSVVNATLYALRTSDQARALLGDEIQFASKIPWIAGELNQLHGRIDVAFWVKGSKGRGRVRFRSYRRERRGYFETAEWSITTEDGRTIHLLGPDGADPFKRIQGREEEADEDAAAATAAVRAR